MKLNNSIPAINEDIIENYKKNKIKYIASIIVWYQENIKNITDNAELFLLIRDAIKSEYNIIDNVLIQQVFELLTGR